MKKLIYISLLIIAFQACNKKETLNHLAFDGQSWYNEIKDEGVNLYNAPYSSVNDQPYFNWRENGIKGSALLFDGYSTYLTTPEVELNESFTISVWVAPRAFDMGADGKLSAIIDQQDTSNYKGFVLGIKRHGNLVVKYGNGTNWIEVKNESFILEKNSWNFITLTKEGAELRLSLNEEIFEQHVPDWKLSNTSIWVGRNRAASGFGEKFKFNMVSGLIDEINMYPEPLSKEEVLNEFETIIANNSFQVSPSDIRLDYTKYNDPHRPAYHALAPAHWMNEPHAPLYYNGKYHLFYQHNPFGPYWGQIHWGHWVSDDMVNWKHVSIALAPEAGDLDPDGIWSGSAFVGPDNIPYLYYTAGSFAKEQNQYTSIAYPADTADPSLEEWKKTGIIINKPDEYLKNEFRDPYIFEVDGTYYMIVGTGIKDKGGSAALFQSSNAIDWEYLNPFYISDIEKYPYLGGVWELPIVLPVNRMDGKPNEVQKYVLMVLPLRNEADVEVFYWIGEFDKQNTRFVPDHEEPKLVDYGDFGFTGPSGLVDPKTGRSIVFTIAQGKYGNLDTYDMGWAHNAGLPVEVALDANNELIVRPIEELKSLRGEKLISCEGCSLEEVNDLLSGASGDQLEILVEFDKMPAGAGLEVRKTPNEDYKAIIKYDKEKGGVVFDKVQPDPETDFKPLVAPMEEGGSALKLHLFLDKSMMEVYINYRKSITNRIYFDDPKAKGLSVTGPEDLMIKSIQVWKVNGIDWEYAN